MRTAALSLLITATLAIMTADTASAEIKWQTNLRAAQAQADAQGKLLLLHFYSDNCIWCDRLEAGAFQAAQVNESIMQGYVPVKIHGGKNPQLVEMFKITKFPTDVIVTPKGQTLSHSVSPQQPSRYASMLGGAIELAKKAAVAQPAAAPPQKSMQSTPVAQTNQFTQPNHAAMPNGASAQMASSRTDDMSLSVPTTVATATIPTSSPAPAHSPQADPELAMQGFCPVTVIQEDRWVEGNPKFGVIHLGKLYLFANADRMQTFLADPIPYTPVLNEIDVVRFFEERKIVKGKREWGLKDPTHNRMFFFADEAAMNHFWNEYERYTGAAINVMEKAVRDSNPGI